MEEDNKNDENVEEVKEEEKSSVSPVEEAKDVLEKISEQNKILEENLNRAEKIQARDILSGRSLAGKQEKPDQNAGAKSLIAGSGYEKELFPDDSHS